MKILMIGPQGSGKGTIGALLNTNLGIPLISVGNLLRELSPSHPRYLEVKTLMGAGQLVPTELLADLIIDRVNIGDCRKGYILDGWCRRVADLNFFNPGFDKVVYLNISAQTTITRLSTRRICSVCGAVYNVITKPPKIDGVCDICGGKVIHRDDDKKEAIKKRLEIFNTETIPVINHFSKLGILVKVEAEGTPESVLKDVLLAIE